MFADVFSHIKVLEFDATRSFVCVLVSEILSNLQNLLNGPRSFVETTKCVKFKSPRCIGFKVGIFTSIAQQGYKEA